MVFSVNNVGEYPSFEGYFYQVRDCIEAVKRCAWRKQEHFSVSIKSNQVAEKVLEKLKQGLSENGFDVKHLQPTGEIRVIWKRESMLRGSVLADLLEGCWANSSLEQNMLEKELELEKIISVDELDESYVSEC